MLSLSCVPLRHATHYGQARGREIAANVLHTLQKIRLGSLIASFEAETYDLHSVTRRNLLRESIFLSVSPDLEE
jgi:hypothetical protein